MKSVAPVGILMIVLLSIIVIFFRDGEDVLKPSPKMETESTTAVVSGEVLDSTGAPLGGIPVRAIDSAPSGNATRVEAVTDNEGRFSLTVSPGRGIFEIKALPPGRTAFPLNCIVSTSPLLETEVVLREPEQIGPAPAGPNVAGEVSDQNCRAVRGITIVAVSKSGKTLARSVTDEAGAFSMVIETVPPFTLRIQEYAEVELQVPILPSLYNSLLVVTPKPREETLYLEPRGDITATDRVLKILILHSMVGRQDTGQLRVEDSPWRFEGVPFGTYDIRVWNDDLAGLVRNFRFDEENRKAVVELSAPAFVGGDTEVRSRAALIPIPPMGETLLSETREEDGRSGRVRRSLMDTECRSRDFKFKHVPAGDYILLVTAIGYEPLEMPLALAPGENRNLGLIPMKKATGSAHFYLNDRNQETNEHGYLLTLYTTQGDVLEYKTDPGESAHVTITSLCEGTWWYRAERRMAGGSLRSVNSDLSFVVNRDQKTEVEVDLTWRFE